MFGAGVRLVYARRRVNPLLLPHAMGPLYQMRIKKQSPLHHSEKRGAGKNGGCPFQTLSKGPIILENNFPGLW